MTIDDEVLRQAAALGIEPPPGAGEPTATTIEVWDVNWDAFAIFRACGTQWRVAATQHALVHLGLDYPGVEIVMRRLADPDTDLSALFGDIMVCEAAALQVLNEVPA